MKVQTFFQHVPGIDPTPEVKLILLWIRQWEAMGFTPVVLNEFHASTHPLYDDFCASIAKLPSINPPGYDRACWMRWLAMANINGGLMADYDVLLYDPAWTPTLRTGTYMTVFQGHVPSVVAARKGGYEFMVDQIINYKMTDDDLENGRPHISDMHMLVKQPKCNVLKLMEVKMFNEEGWETAPIVHYSNGAIKPAGKMPRHQTIPELRK